MQVHTAQFIKSAMNPVDYPKDRRLEIAFVGRSNVGKSTLMNRLLGKRGLAKTSSRPGKTQTINFFSVNEHYYFVDLPGYGYAKAPKQVKEKWNRAMGQYFRERDTLRMVAALVDARHKPTAQDVEMLALLDELAVPTLVVATKIDKVKRGQRQQHLALIRRTLELDADAEVLPVSAEGGEGIRELWRIIDDQLG